jgi:hypothetical protein
MKLRHYKTSVRLWLYLALALFVALWFVPFDIKGSTFYPAYLWPAFIIALFRSDVPLREVGELLPMLGWYTLVCGIPALAIAWVLQCVVQMIRHRHPLETDPTAMNLKSQ